MKVCIADDDEIFRKAATNALTRCGYEVWAFSDGGSVWQAISNELEPAIVVLDWVLPDTTALELCENFVQMDLKRNLHVIAVSSVSESEKIVKVLENGADDHLAKPVAIPELVARIRIAERNLLKNVNMEQKLLDIKKTEHSRYHLKKLISRGGWGEVFESWDAALNRTVAIKRFNLQADINASADDELWREAKITARLQHPNIVTIYDFWTSMGLSFVVMELLSGVTLGSLVDESRISMDLLTHVTLQALAGISAAHQAGVLHCDLQPSNIMLLGDPRNDPEGILVKILDFGVAKIMQENRPASQENEDVVRGSVFYIAPEILLSDPMDQRSDLYSLGHILYEALTGKNAITGDTVEEVVLRHIRGGFTPISKYRDDIPEEICQWVESLMQREPDDRPTTSHEALESFKKLVS